MPRQNTKTTPVKPIIAQRPIIAQQPIRIVDAITPKQPIRIVDAIKEGFGFGLGSTIARNIFSSSPININTPISETKTNCIEYNKCLESDDKYECFANLDQKEYVACRIKN